MSDGDNTTGRSPAEAGQAARAAKVPVSTIAFGTQGGTVNIEGESVPVPPSLPTLRDLAEATGGRSFTAEAASQLARVYTSIGRSVGFRIEHRETTSQWVFIAMLLSLAAGGASLGWFGRLP